MESAASFRRVLVKISGEALKGETAPLDVSSVGAIARQLNALRESGVQTSLVLGGGNLFRGLGATQGGMERNVADHIGMLATVMNALGVKEVLGRMGVRVHVQTPFAMPGVTDAFNHADADDQLNRGDIVLFAGGTGHPFFTTDTAAALRACQISADALLKATKVDGVFTDDPQRNSEAKRYRSISYEDVLRARLGVMDGTAFTLCRDNDIPIVVFNFSRSEGLTRLFRGEMDTATYVGRCETSLDEAVPPLPR